MQENINEKCRVNVSSINSNTSISSLNKFENWRGLANIKSKKQKKPNYLDDCPDWDYVQSNKAIQIPLSKNGNLCESVKIGEVLVLIKETWLLILSCN